ncbi:MULTISPECIES: DUF2147 domain-containing protein [Sphingobacterium]|uniref:DUF2147 domain-containing protein n=1 Tax=Sphingobacterium tenebrionis TaxID=3111775 RepID=A0ABU8IB18_9SPHI|nr:MULTISPECIES: DUF2147 domain-containing protein [unclassified Sphingobacterium]QBR10788.1 DUF2147 domain-containing protein [Sphingobacterium sp. CZ-2]
MKQVLMTLCALFITVALYAQSDPILGKWQNPSGEGRIEIYKKNGEKFYGKLYWIKDSAKKDAKNPDPKLRSRNIQGLEILSGFVKESKTYVDGTIYDPKSGKTYSCKMTLKGDDKLDIRGYIGISMLGRSETWTRIK